MGTCCMCMSYTKVTNASRYQVRCWREGSCDHRYIEPGATEQLRWCRSCAYTLCVQLVELPPGNTVVKESPKVTRHFFTSPTGSYFVLYSEAANRMQIYTSSGLDIHRKKSVSIAHNPHMPAEAVPSSPVEESHIVFPEEVQENVSDSE
eukprot:scpid87219/ scgid29256/ 